MQFRSRKCFRALVLKLLYQNPLESLLKHRLLITHQFDLVGLPGRRVLRVCTSNKFLGDTDAAGPGTTL